MDELYPWGGEFTACKSTSTVAVVLLNSSYIPPKSVAIYGYLKTENIGIEKIIANVISNPNIRYLIVYGEDIRGHRSGQSLISLYQNGINEHHKINGAQGAIPYIENLDKEAISRFQKQVEVIDLIGTHDEHLITNIIEKYLAKNSGSFGKSYIAIRLVKHSSATLDDKRALHSKIIIDYMGHIKNRE